MSEFKLDFEKILSDNLLLNEEQLEKIRCSYAALADVKEGLDMGRKEYEIVAPFARRSSGLPSTKGKSIYRR